MASQAYIQHVLGAAPSAMTVATDATSLSGDTKLRIIIGKDLTRDQAAQMLDDVRMEILDTRRDWTVAST